MTQASGRSATASSFLDTIGSAVYLGISWTWCIGMFLPVLLVRDYGTWGWVLFAAPNILGAAVMGWLIGADASKAIRAAHRPALAAFAVVTVAFQFFFALWIFDLLGVSAYAYLSVVVIFATLMAAILAGPWPSRYALAAVVLVTSLCCWWIFSRSTNQPPLLDHFRGLRDAPPRELLYLFPAMVFGFALCPYLDPTFHAVRSRLGRSQAKLAFSLGFGVVFAGMILFTLAYTMPLLYRFSPEWMPWLAAHWVGQLAFTIAAQLAVVSSDGRAIRYRHLGWFLIAAAVLAGAAWIISRGNLLGQPINTIRGEVVYRYFMGFYALVFPAYVWLCVMPTRGRAAPTPRQLLVFALAIIIAAPMFWLGFIERRMLWLLPGLTIVLSARIFVRGKIERQDAESPGAESA